MSPEGVQDCPSAVNQPIRSVRVSRLSWPRVGTTLPTDGHDQKHISSHRQKVHLTDSRHQFLMVSVAKTISIILQKQDNDKCQARSQWSSKDENVLEGDLLMVGKFQFLEKIWKFFADQK